MSSSSSSSSKRPNEGWKTLYDALSDSHSTIRSLTWWIPTILVDNSEQDDRRRRAPPTSSREPAIPGTGLRELRLAPGRLTATSTRSATDPAPPNPLRPPAPTFRSMSQPARLPQPAPPHPLAQPNDVAALVRIRQPLQVRQQVASVSVPLQPPHRPRPSSLRGVLMLESFDILSGVWTIYIHHLIPIRYLPWQFVDNSLSSAAGNR